METKFNAYDILEIAEQIERNGIKFYHKAAQLFDNNHLHQVLGEQAQWCTKHIKIFAHMRKRFSEQTGEFGTFDPDNYVLSNPRVMAALAVFTDKPGLAGKLTGSENEQKILREAIRRRKDAIVFYKGLSDFARDMRANEILAEIIREEKRHINLLNDRLGVLEKTD